MMNTPHMTPRACDILVMMNTPHMTPHAKEHERQDTKEVLETVVKETKASIRLIQEKLYWIENWKPDESIPDDCCICDFIDKCNKSLEDDLRQEQTSLLSWQQKLKQIEEEEGEEGEEGEESDAKRPKIQ